MRTITDEYHVCVDCGESLAGCELCGVARIRELTPEEKKEQYEKWKEEQEEMKPIPIWVFYH